MESWDLWADFLAVIAGRKEYNLSSAETEAFKARFAKEYIDKEVTSEDVEKIAENLTIRKKKGEESDPKAAYKKRMTEVFKKFQAVIPHEGPDKSVTLLKWLKAQYVEWQKHDYPEIWPQICRDILTEQQKKQQLPRQVTEFGFELNMYVPLGLLERKQQQRRDESVPKDDVYQLNPQVIVKEYENQQFLTEVIQGGNDQRLAIIGEPGAGKTTLLDQIASWIDDKNLGLPICIPLGGLQGETLAGYLLKIWLKQATKSEATQENLAASLEQQFRSGKVWLLLDAVDEMPAASPAEALAKIRDELVGWVAEARVVLTCRLNVWDASVNNPLPGFKTYRTLEFKPEKVDKFIRDWFTEAHKKYPSDNCLSKGEKLLNKLKESNRTNIYKLVRNPLRLALLCQTFYLSPDEELPETQAMLYERFIRYFYEWKQEKQPNEWKRDEEKQIDGQQKLNQKLEKLAKEGIKSKGRFRLSKSFAIDKMGISWFKLAKDLLWLNLVDRDVKTDEEVYAFFHPTFQEYFAARAIEDWHFFLNHVPDNPQLGIYRIFERRWKEVMLLWVGRDNVLFEQKEGFIKALIEFDDGFNREFYWYRSVFVASVLIAEFKDCSLADAIVAEIVKWGFGYFNVEKQKWERFFYLIAERAREVLKETDREKSIAALVELIGTSQDESNRRRAADILGKIDKDNPVAIAALVESKRNSQDKVTRLRTVDSLDKIDKEPPDPIAPLIQLIRNPQSELTLLKAAYSLGKIGKDNPDAITALIELISNSQSEDARWNAADSLGKIAKNNPDAIAALVKFLPKAQSENTRSKVAKTLGEIGKDNPDAIAALVELIRTSQDENTRLRAANSLGEILTVSQHIAGVVSALKDYLSDETYNNDFYRFEDCYKVLWHCAQNLPYPTFYEAWHHPPTTPTTITLNWQTFPQDIARAINNDANLSNHLKPISIDINKFLNPDNPAAKIYSEMLLQGCPKSQDSKPKTLAELQTYWDELRIESDIPPLLIFYDSQTGTENATAFSNTFLKALSKFDGFICAVCNAAEISLPTFSPSQPNLIANMVGWMREKMMES
ncbi:NACHT domain-containing protein [Phormidium nigroviride]